MLFANSGCYEPSTRRTAPAAATRKNLRVIVLTFEGIQVVRELEQVLNFQFPRAQDPQKHTPIGNMLYHVSESGAETYEVEGGVIWATWIRGTRKVTLTLHPSMWQVVTTEFK